MLELRAVTKHFGKDVRAVDGVTLSLGQGVVGLIGHSGAGKSTLMGMIATLARPSSSSQILFDGVDIVRKPDAIRRWRQASPGAGAPSRFLRQRCID